MSGLSKDIYVTSNLEQIKDLLLLDVKVAMLHALKRLKTCLLMLDMSSKLVENLFVFVLISVSPDTKLIFNLSLRDYYIRE